MLNHAAEPLGLLSSHNRTDGGKGTREWTRGPDTRLGERASPKCRRKAGAPSTAAGEDHQRWGVVGGGAHRAPALYPVPLRTVRTRQRQACAQGLGVLRHGSPDHAKGLGEAEEDRAAEWARTPSGRRGRREGIVLEKRGSPLWA